MNGVSVGPKMTAFLYKKETEEESEKRARSSSGPCQSKPDYPTQFICLVSRLDLPDHHIVVERGSGKAVWLFMFEFLRTETALAP